MTSTARRVQKKLTPAAVRAKLAQLRASLGDPEAFHAYEDDLLVEVLTAIRDGRCSDPAECAAVALESRGWDDATRWYA